MYRAVGWKALHDQVALDDEDAVASLADRARIDVSDARVTIDGHDVTRAIRTPEIDKAATAVARLPRVRAVLSRFSGQRGAAGGIVMEGRDIGTVVFPTADVKVYLDRRARRTRPTPRERSGAHRRAVSGRPMCNRCCRSATNRIAREPRRRCTPRRTPSSSTPRARTSTRSFAR
jgi:cytidylate kinase